MHVYMPRTFLQRNENSEKSFFWKMCLRGQSQILLYKVKYIYRYIDISLYLDIYVSQSPGSCTNENFKHTQKKKKKGGGSIIGFQDFCEHSLPQDRWETQMTNPGASSLCDLMFIHPSPVGFFLFLFSFSMTSSNYKVCQEMGEREIE